MKTCRVLLFSLMVFSVFSTTAIADDFAWTRDFNIQAKADPAGFRARIGSRFDLDDFQVRALLNIFNCPADAYIMLRLGEMQGMLKGKLSREQGIAVIKKYRRNRSKGWVTMAESLGVKSGSKEFLALKQGHDLQGDIGYGQVVYSVYNIKNVN
ncbi:MAG: hypothetical protein JRF02_06385 [Deltaproteobacteria bacterium]|jgi:hypothetical protein|nr:hypothetical protein [Deltaproteobacteria bacterium]